ncbi:hypothetical protein SKAU_G00266380 [Synaphobranchus kaupii]|uniref:Uncharacterized protein n=1 Tax=Synaphobranchus kaupii TaxID=118154 RepID=A0A9Q1EZP4_SYNKA|nr:hypothetical protein SKAU_G00266380 [Synaphobranchus kaupii]
MLDESYLCHVSHPCFSSSHKSKDLNSCFTRHIIRRCSRAVVTRYRYDWVSCWVLRVYIVRWYYVPRITQADGPRAGNTQNWLAVSKKGARQMPE